MAIDASDVDRRELVGASARFRLGSGPLTIHSEEMERTEERPSRPVNLLLLRRGLFKFRFLLDCAHPGSVPDASMLAALLDLVCPLLLLVINLMYCTVLYIYSSS